MMKSSILRAVWLFLVCGAVCGAAGVNDSFDPVLLQNKALQQSGIKNGGEYDFKDIEAEFGDELNANKIADPLIGYNRAMTEFNDYFYRYFLSPVLAGYGWAVPDAAKNAISNVFHNILFPVRFVNNVLQFKFKNAGDETLRFLANTIVGFGGISDVASSYYKLPKHDEDFGQTLGHYGVGGGFAVVLPFLGQSNIRDIIGLSGDWFINPVSYSHHWWASDSTFGTYIVKGWYMVNEGSKNPYLYEQMTAGAVDKYELIKSSYEQLRNKQIKE